MIEYIVCDDNEIVLNNLKLSIDKIMINYKVDYLIKLFRDYTEDFINEIKVNNRTKVYILDIETPTSSGFEIAKKIREVDLNSYIIFYTGHNTLGLRAIKMDIFFSGYINKFENAENRLRNIIEKTVLNDTGVNLINISTKSFTYQFKIADILYITREINIRKTVIHTSNDFFEINKNLHQVMKLFDNRFIQTHRSCYVNKTRIKKVDLANNEIIFDNNEKISLLSNKFKKDLEL